jgi:hypothetical protein
MRPPFVAGKTALVERMQTKGQIEPTAPTAELPDYLESFLAHVRLLVGVPFEYLVPDPRLLPDESIRFFYLDRSWADRLVDGALAVGKIGTREQAHHHAHHAPVAQRLDATERSVRDLQRQRVVLADVRPTNETEPPPPAGVVTGFLLRSAAVAGWPDMDVRAFDTILHEPVDPAQAEAHQLRTLRLERLAPAVLLALFDGVPKLVWCEEPHHGVQFGVERGSSGGFRVPRRDATGQRLDGFVTAPTRARKPRVLSIAGLRRELVKADTPNTPAVNQTGAAAFAIQCLDVPWRQRFQGNGGADLGRAHSQPVRIEIVAKVAEPATAAAFDEVVRR